MFSCEYCKIFKNTYFEKDLWTAASEIVAKNYFCVRQKYRQKYNQYYKLLFLNIHIHFVTSNYELSYRKVSLIRTNSIYLVSCSLEIQETHI